MQKITQNPKFDTLNDSDKNILLIASLIHDCTKKEGERERLIEILKYQISDIDSYSLKDGEEEELVL